jgi:hypothetical protein
MNIWNEYIKLFSNDNPVVITGTVIATIAVLTFLVNFLLKPLFQWLSKLFAKINVTLGMSHQIEQSMMGTAVLPPLLTVTITNKDRVTRYIQNPSVKTSRKINGDNKFVVPKAKGTYPKKLEPGEQDTVDFDTLSLNNQILSHLKPADEINIIVTDTTGKKYKSNKFTVKHITGHIQTANSLNR